MYYRILKVVEGQKLGLGWNNEQMIMLSYYHL